RAFLVLDGMPLGMAGHLKTPEESTNSGPKILHLFGHDYPHIRARVPGPAAVVAQDRFDRKSGSFESPGHVPDRQRPECQHEAVLGFSPAAADDVGLIECRQPAARV